MRCLFLRPARLLILLKNGSQGKSNDHYLKLLKSLGMKPVCPANTIRSWFISLIIFTHVQSTLSSCFMALTHGSRMHAIVSSNIKNDRQSRLQVNRPICISKHFLQFLEGQKMQAKHRRKFM